ncbi:hypothetical protein BDL97_05G084600 [Sphagnum fallax]|nr:hypothetical protein BDL97_05G084600 [Sphagnum fallax]
MKKGALLVVEVSSEDDDDDFAPTPSRASQTSAERKRKKKPSSSAGHRKSDMGKDACKTPVMKRSPYFSNPGGSGGGSGSPASVEQRRVMAVKQKGVPVVAAAALYRASSQLSMRDVSKTELDEKKVAIATTPTPCKDGSDAALGISKTDFPLNYWLDSLDDEEIDALFPEASVPTTKSNMGFDLQKWEGVKAEKLSTEKNDGNPPGSNDFRTRVEEVTDKAKALRASSYGNGRYEEVKSSPRSLGGEMRLSKTEEEGGVAAVTTEACLNNKKLGAYDFSGRDEQEDPDSLSESPVMTFQSPMHKPCDKTKIQSMKSTNVAFNDDEDMELDLFTTAKSGPQLSVDLMAALLKLKSTATKEQICHIEVVAARSAKFAECDYKLPLKLQKAISDRGINQLYSHQAEAINTIFNGSSIVAATPTASGKSMTYIVPVLDALIKMPKSRAFFIFPMKALARDQLKTLSEMAKQVNVGSYCYCYDGDTKMEDRAGIRKTGKIIVTNPDMLHSGILPNHKLWEKFFSNLKFVVLDEAHTYRGVFGSHVGCILRRLLRIARHYGSEPMFICCSATIGNPKEHVKRLTTVDMEVISGTGAPTGEKHVVCWLPPLNKEKQQRNTYREAAKIVSVLIQANLQILVFVEARKLAEIVCHLIRAKLIKLHRQDLVEKVDCYRAGYSKEERIILERRLQHGDLRALVTTRALELGIDVGELDATVHVGLPNTVCSLWQQAGRAGRRQGRSLAVIVAQGRPLDVFYMQNPQKLFERDVEHAFCNPCNPHLLRLQLPCAARELPLSDEDQDYFGDAFERLRYDLSTEGILQFKQGPKGQQLYSYRYDDNPASDFSIRGTSSNCFQLLTETNTLIEEVDEKMALRMLYEGAIYPHIRDTYRIVKLDIAKKQAVGKLSDVHHITEVKEKTSLVILEYFSSQKTAATRAHLGRLKVKLQVLGYDEIDMVKSRVEKTVMLDYPPSEFDTVGLWWDIPADVMQKLNNLAYDALVVLRRVVLSLLPSMTMSDPTDTAGLEVLIHEQTQLPQIFIFDAYPGGIGISEQAFKDIAEAWKRALCVLHSCNCSFGCPSCTQTVHNNTMANASNSCKHAAITLIEALLGIHQTHVITPSPPNTSLVSSNGKNLEAQPIRHREVQIVKASDPVKKLGAAAGLAEEKDICTVRSFASPKAFGIRAKTGTHNLDSKPDIIDLC